jgi:uncharacterized ferredoxin-like protein
MKEVSEMVVNLMAASARTAPKAGGKDFLEIVIVTDEGDLKKIAERMKKFAPVSTNEAYWLRDASNIENSQALLLIGLSKPVTAGYDGIYRATLCYEDDGYRSSTLLRC